jgi:hypothetical protein
LKKCVYLFVCLRWLLEFVVLGRAKRGAGVYGGPLARKGFALSFTVLRTARYAKPVGPWVRAQGIEADTPQKLQSNFEELERIARLSRFLPEAKSARDAPKFFRLQIHLP